MNSLSIFCLFLLHLAVLLEISCADPSPNQLEPKKIKDIFDRFICKYLLAKGEPKEYSKISHRKAVEILNKVRTIAESYVSKIRNVRGKGVEFRTAILEQFPEADGSSLKWEMDDQRELTSKSLSAETNAQLFHLLFSFAIRMALCINPESELSKTNSYIFEALRETKANKPAGANEQLPIFEHEIRKRRISSSLKIFWEKDWPEAEKVSIKSILRVIQSPASLMENVFIEELFTDYLENDGVVAEKVEEKKVKFAIDKSSSFLSELFEMAKDSIVVWDKASGHFECKQIGPLDAERTRPMLENIYLKLFPKNASKFKQSWTKVWFDIYLRREGERRQQTGQRAQADHHSVRPPTQSKLPQLLPMLFSFAIQLAGQTTILDLANKEFFPISFLAAFRCLSGSKMPTAENMSPVSIREEGLEGRFVFFNMNIIEWVMPNEEKGKRRQIAAVHNFNSLLCLSKMDNLTPYSLFKFAKIVKRLIDSQASNGHNRLRTVNVNPGDSLAKLFIIVSGKNLAEIVENEGEMRGKQSIELELYSGELCSLARFGRQTLNNYCNTNSNADAMDLGEQLRKYYYLESECESRAGSYQNEEQQQDDKLFYYENFIRVNLNAWTAKMQLIEDIKNYISSKVYKYGALFQAPKEENEEGKGGLEESPFGSNEIIEATVKYENNLLNHHLGYDYYAFKNIVEDEAKRMARQLAREFGIVAQLSDDSLVEQFKNGSQEMPVLCKLLPFYHSKFTSDQQKVETLRNAVRNWDKISEMKFVQPGVGEVEHLWKILEEEHSQEYLELIEKLEEFAGDLQKEQAKENAVEEHLGTGLL